MCKSILKPVMGVWILKILLDRIATVAVYFNVGFCHQFVSADERELT